MGILYGDVDLDSLLARGISQNMQQQEAFWFWTRLRRVSPSKDSVGLPVRVPRWLREVSRWLREVLVASFRRFSQGSSVGCSGVVLGGSGGSNVVVPDVPACVPGAQNCRILAQINVQWVLAMAQRQNRSTPRMNTSSGRCLYFRPNPRSSNGVPSLVSDSAFSFWKSSRHPQTSQPVGDPDHFGTHNKDHFGTQQKNHR